YQRVEESLSDLGQLGQSERSFRELSVLHLLVDDPVDHLLNGVRGWLLYLEHGTTCRLQRVGQHQYRRLRGSGLVTDVSEVIDVDHVAVLGACLLVEVAHHTVTVVADDALGDIGGNLELAGQGDTGGDMTTENFG